MPYKVDLPETLTIVDPRTKKGFPITAKQWLLEMLDDDKMGRTARDLLARDRMEAKVHDAEGSLRLTDDEYTKLCAVVEEPTGGYKTKVAKQMMTFIKAILEAEKVE